MPRLSSQELADIEVAMPGIQDLDPFDDEVDANDQLQAEATGDADVESDDTIEHSSVIDAEVEDEVEVVQKRPGHPLKRKRGRPAKNASSADDSSQVDQIDQDSPAPTTTPPPISAPKRKRGRPAKKASSAGNSSQVDQTTASSPGPDPTAEPVSGRSDHSRRPSSPADSLPSQPPALLSVELARRRVICPFWPTLPSR